MKQTKSKLILTLSLIILAVFIFSCEKESKVIKPLGEVEANSPKLKSMTIPLEVPELTDDHCGEPKVYELWQHDIGWGTVTVFNDNEFLYVRYALLPEYQNGWGIRSTYLFAGTSLPEGWNDGPWAVSPFEQVDYNPALPVVTRILPIEDYMLLDCFIIATKVKIIELSSGISVATPRAYIVGENNYSWEDEYCLVTCDPGTGTIGYWKNHPEAWPVDEIMIGGITYTRDEAIEIMKAKKVKGDKTHDMFAQLVAAKLNVKIGNSSGCIDNIIESADDWMSIHNVGTGVSADSEAWKMAEDWHEMLDDYNNGRLCAPHRDD